MWDFDFLRLKFEDKFANVNIVYFDVSFLLNLSIKGVGFIWERVLLDLTVIIIKLQVHFNRKILCYSF